MVVDVADVIALAQAKGRAGDPLVRQELARLHTLTLLGQWNARRAKAEAARGGGAIANLGKLAQTRIMKLAAELAVTVLGADGMLAAPDGTHDGRYTAALVFSPASSIYGGTDEIQRNVIGERTLGLPRDHLPGRGLPYGEVLEAITLGEVPMG
jgi:alkylation response protein AidB-like acyl-CoA dehydrogenase